MTEEERFEQVIQETIGDIDTIEKKTKLEFAVYIYMTMRKNGASVDKALDFLKNYENFKMP